jgi:hypothetical protein
MNKEKGKDKYSINFRFILIAVAVLVLAIGAIIAFNAYDKHKKYKDFLATTASIEKSPSLQKLLPLVKDFTGQDTVANMNINCYLDLLMKEQQGISGADLIICKNGFYYSTSWSPRACDQNYSTQINTACLNETEMMLIDAAGKPKTEETEKIIFNITKNERIIKTIVKFGNAYIIAEMGNNNRYY